jgi:hypothetical protein
VKKNGDVSEHAFFLLPFIPSRQPFDVLPVPRKIEGGRGEYSFERGMS